MAPRIRDKGEFGLIGRIAARTSVMPGVRVGIGDDAAVLRGDAREDVLLTTDLLIEDRHFKRRDASAYEIGRKAMAVNVSDIAAMGGVPTYAVVSVALPGDLPLAFADDLYRGLRSVADAFGVAIVGGDTNASDKIVVNVALLGRVSRGKAVLRSGAKAGDLIFVTGELGGSYHSKKHLHFTPRLKEAGYLVSRFKLGAMMDLSDGLASDLYRLADASCVGAVLFDRAIPKTKYAKGPQAALVDGEDFELLFTLSGAEAARFLSARHPRGLAPFALVGKITPRRSGLNIMDADGVLRKLSCDGFDHFKARSR